MLGIYCVWEERDLYSGKLALKQGLGFAFSSIRQSHQVTFDDTQGVLRTYSNPGPHNSSKPRKAIKSIKTWCVWEIEMPPIMANDQGHKSKYIQTSRKLLGHRVKTLVPTERSCHYKYSLFKSYEQGFQICNFSITGWQTGQNNNTPAPFPRSGA